MFASRLFWSALLIQVMLTPAVMAIAYGLLVVFENYAPWWALCLIELVVLGIISYSLLRGWFSQSRAFLIAWGVLATTLISVCMIVLLIANPSWGPALTWQWYATAAFVYLSASLPMPLVFYTLRQKQRLASPVMLPPDC